MACRLHNLHDKTLGIDLRGGEVLMLPPNTTSRAIIEESLYDNQHLAEWERAGWVRRVPARMDDVIAEAGGLHAFDARFEEFEAARAEAKAEAAEREAARAEAAIAEEARDDEAAKKSGKKAESKPEKKAEK